VKCVHVKMLCVAVMGACVFENTCLCFYLKVSSETPTPIVRFRAVLLSTGQYLYIILYRYDV